MIKEIKIAKITEIRPWVEEVTDHILSFFARFRMFEKVSKFCGHVCRLDL